MSSIEPHEIHDLKTKVMNLDNRLGFIEKASETHKNDIIYLRNDFRDTRIAHEERFDKLISLLQEIKDEFNTDLGEIKGFLQKLTGSWITIKYIAAVLVGSIATIATIMAIFK